MTSLPYSPAIKASHLAHFALIPVPICMVHKSIIIPKAAELQISVTFTECNHDRNCRYCELELMMTEQ